MAKINGRVINIQGLCFGRLIVVSYQGIDKWKQAVWLCQCLCGEQVVVRGQALRLGATRSCGCYKREQDLVHGMAKKNSEGKVPPEYDAYMHAKYRCENPNAQRYENYGGRGIKFLFTSFDQFFSEIGPRPKGMTLDRRDNDRNYEPGNVRWATPKEQANNRRKQKLRKAANA